MVNADQKDELQEVDDLPGDDPSSETEPTAVEDDLQGSVEDDDGTAAENGVEEDAPAVPEADEAEAEAAVEDAVLAPAPAGDSGFEWYVIRVQSGREDTISNKLVRKLQLTKLDHLVETVVVPKQKVTEIKEGKKRIRELKLYPGYFFMQCKLDEDLWYLLRDTPGVGDFVGTSTKPMPMTPTEVKKILDVIEERESEAPPEVKIDVAKNDTVKIKEGPFENFEGIVQEVQPAKGVLRVMVTIFGRETPVDLEYWQVEKT